MFSIRPGHIVALAFLLAPALAALPPVDSANAPKYLLPPKPVVNTFDAPPLPQAMVSPSRQVIALEFSKGHPSIAELAQPMLRLAGFRVNPKTNGPHLTSGIDAITLQRIADGREIKLAVPAQANLSNLHFSPDGAHLSFLATKEGRIELWVADTATGATKLLSGTDRLNAASGDPCDWRRDNTTLV